MCLRYLQLQARAVWFLATCAHIWEPAESQSWGHVGSIETSSRVSKHSFPSKSNYCSCRCGHLGLQVARRRGFTGLEAALQFACFFGLAGRLRLCGAMPIPSQRSISVCACVICSCKLTQPERLFHAPFVRIWEPAASQSWGHVGLFGNWLECE